MRNLKKGFTLIELLIAITILGVLSALLLANLQETRARARDSQRKQDLYQVKQALRLYYSDNQEFPDSSDGSISGYAWGDPFIDGGTTYMKTLPEDPFETGYYYNKIGDDSYELYACLENKSDDAGTACPGSFSCDSTVCYKVMED